MDVEKDHCACHGRDIFKDQDRACLYELEKEDMTGISVYAPHRMRYLRPCSPKLKSRPRRATTSRPKDVVPGQQWGEASC